MSEFGRLLSLDNEANCNSISNNPSIRAAYKLLFADDVNGAISRFQKLLKDNPRDNEALAGLAICVADDSGRFVTATKIAREAVRLAPKSAAGYYALAYVHLRGSKLEPGYRYLLKAKQLSPQDPRLNIGYALFEQEREPVVSDLPRSHPVNQVMCHTRSFMRSPGHRMLVGILLLEGAYLATSLVA